MDNVTYERMLSENDTDIPQLLKVYRMPVIARYLSISQTYFHYVTNTENVYFYKIYKNDQLVASTHIEQQGTILCLDVLVFPEYQRMGLGTKIIEDIQNNVLGLAYEAIEISIDERNTASLTLFENAGFIRVSKDAELINLVYQRIENCNL